MRFFGGSILRKQAECRAEPTLGAGGRQPEGCLTRLAQQRDRVSVTLARRALDVMCARGRACSLLRQCLGAASVGTQAPAGRRLLVNRPPHEWVAEEKSTRDIGRPDDVESQQLVDRLDGQLGRHACCGRRKIEFERIAGHRRALQDRSAGLRYGRDFLRQRHADARRNAGDGRSRRGTTRRLRA